ncbi:MAG: MCE family protein [Flavobacteriales bacterium]|nr:MAG: MCE family protein [Flavobacteriales bacterium]
MKKEYSIAITVIVGVALLVFGYNYLKGRDLFQKENIYHGVFDNAGGVAAATPLMLNGYKVGQVLRSKLLYDGTNRVVMTFQINEDELKIPKDSRIQIVSDLLSTGTQLVLGTSAELAVRGDTLVGLTSPSLTASLGAQIDPIKQKAEAMLGSVDSVITAFQLILNPSTIANIDSSFISIRETLHNLSDASKRLDALIAAESATLDITLKNLASVTGNLEQNNDELSRIFSNLDSLSGALADGRVDTVLQGISEAASSLKGVMNGIEQGQGTLGQLAKNDSLYNNLNSSMAELDLLLEDLRVNPNRYVTIFGKKDRLPKLSEADIKRIQEAYEKQKK